MNSETKFFAGVRRIIFTLGFAFASLLLGGCWKDSIVWAPDGSRAAVITSDGLRLCDANGKLSNLLVPHVYRAAWLSDSKRLVLARERPLKDFAEVAAALGPERAKQLIAKAEYLWAPLEAGLVAPKDLDITPTDDAWAVLVYLRDKHGDAFLKLMGSEIKDVDDSFTVPWHSLVMAKLTGDTVELGTTLDEGLAQVQAIRPAPSDAAVAFTKHIAPSPDSDNGLQLLLVPSDGLSAPVVVATHTAAHPDWTPDGKTLVFFRCSHAPNGDDPRLGALAERTVLAADGHIQLEEHARELASSIFQEGNRVRCLSDGRVLFDAPEIQIPTTSIGQSREQFFALDRTRDVLELKPLIPAERLKSLPRTLSFFEVSPDGTHVLFGGDNSEIWLLTVSTGATEHIVTGLGGGSQIPLPTWCGPDQFTYPRNKGTDKTISLELVLRQPRGETNWSGAWPQEVLNKLTNQE